LYCSNFRTTTLQLLALLRRVDMAFHHRRLSEAVSSPFPFPSPSLPLPPSPLSPFGRGVG
jgi:hypothetical protein